MFVCWPCQRFLSLSLLHLPSSLSLFQQFHERVQLDSITHNELGDPDMLAHLPPYAPGATGAIGEGWGYTLCGCGVHVWLMVLVMHDYGGIGSTCSQVTKYPAPSEALCSQHISAQDTFSRASLLFLTHTYTL